MIMVNIWLSDKFVSFMLLQLFWSLIFVLLMQTKKDRESLMTVTVMLSLRGQRRVQHALSIV